MENIAIISDQKSLSENESNSRNASNLKRILDR